MKLSLSRYRSVLLVQISLLIVDLLINTFCEYLRFESVILLVVFVIQDVCLVFSLIIVFLSFFSTYIFQAGLVGVLVQQFRTPIIVTVIYIGNNMSFFLSIFSVSTYIRKFPHVKIKLFHSSPSQVFLSPFTFGVFTCDGRIPCLTGGLMGWWHYSSYKDSHRLCITITTKELPCG